MSNEASAEENEATEITVLLEGEAKVDKRLVTRAVAEINRRHAAGGTATALSIGEFILETFFGDDPAAFKERGKEHLSFRLLAERLEIQEEFKISHVKLWNMVTLVGQYRMLPEATASALSLSHHRLLFPLQDKKKKSLATKAVQGNWTRSKLEDEIRKNRAKEGKAGSSPGRPPLQAFVRGLSRLGKAIDMAEAEAITPEVFATYSPKKAKEALAGLKDDIERLRELEKQLEGVLVARELSTRSGDN